MHPRKESNPRKTGLEGLSPTPSAGAYVPYITKWQRLSRDENTQKTVNLDSLRKLRKNRAIVGVMELAISPEKQVTHALGLGLAIATRLRVALTEADTNQRNLREHHAILIEDEAALVGVASQSGHSLDVLLRISLMAMAIDLLDFSDGLAGQHRNTGLTAVKGAGLGEELDFHEKRYTAIITKCQLPRVTNKSTEVAGAPIRMGLDPRHHQRADSEHGLTCVGSSHTSLRLRTGLRQRCLALRLHGVRVMESAEPVLGSCMLALTGPMEVHPGNGNQIRAAGGGRVVHGTLIPKRGSFCKPPEGVEPSQSALGRLTLVPPAGTTTR